MTLTSFKFYIFILLSMIVFYVCPKKARYLVLLFSSAVFFCFSSKLSLSVYLLLSIVITFACLKFQKKRAALILGIVLNIGLLFFTKYLGLGSGVPIGISFYTLTCIGLLCDNYWDIASPSGNPLKIATFISYWPALTSGPILKYSDTAESMFSASFSFENILSGVFRIVWGVFKKLVIAERLVLITDTIYSDISGHQGWYLWFAAAVFMLQLYADFSGCMDIILGASKCFGIILPENFRTPFFSKTVQEYWQRWHISLGAWLKNYVLYPILTSKAFKALGKGLSGKLGKKASRQIVSNLGSLCVWLIIGLWHGFGPAYIFGMGLWFWGCITIEQYFDPLKKLPLLQMARTFVLVCIGNIFFSTGSVSKTFEIIRLSFNKAVFDFSILGIDLRDGIVCAVGLLILFVYDLLVDRGIISSEYFEKHVALKWVIMIILILATLIFGQYGPGYNPHEFIYQGF